MENKYISKAIKQAKLLRQVVLQMNERGKALAAAEEAEEESLQAKKASTDYPSKQLEKFNEDADDAVADWQPDDENEEILFLCDRILYKLMAQDKDKWINQDDYDERTQLKLKEIVAEPLGMKRGRYRMKVAHHDYLFSNTF